MKLKKLGCKGGLTEPMGKKLYTDYIGLIVMMEC